MLNKYKSKKKSPEQAKNMGRIKLEKKHTAKLEKTITEDSASDTEEESDSDSEYEEILIGSLQKPKKPEPKKEDANPEPNHSNQLRTRTSSDANHFQEQAAPEKPPPKRKSKKVVIKKYYQKRLPVEKEPKAEPIDIPKPVPSAPKRMSYIGIGSRGNESVNSRLSNRILNW